MAMTRSNIAKQLQEGLNAVFGMEYRRHPEQWKQLFAIENSKKAYEEDVLMYGLGAVPVKPEGAGVEYDEGGEAWTSRYLNKTYSLAFNITEEAVEDGLYGPISAKMSKAMARSFQHTKELVHANILNRGFNASYPGGDGVALFSTSHPLAGGGVLSNTFATPADLSEAALEAADIQMCDWVDDRGIPMQVKIKMLAIPTDLKHVASRLLLSPYRPGVGDNDINSLYHNGTVDKHAVNNQFTSERAWFLCSDVPDGLKHFKRSPMRVRMEGDFETGNMRYKGRERYAAGWSDWRGCFGSAGGGA